MPIEEKSVISSKIATDDLQRCKDDLLYFITNHVYTLDEHDRVNPVKKLPMEKQYLKDMIHLFLTERLLLIEKSRQMMVTWMGAAYSLWLVMFHNGKRVFMQSKKEQDANHLVDRCKFIYERLPDYMKEGEYRGDPFSYCKLGFGKRNSIIQGIPQGPEQLRQYTASLLWADEMAFQEQAEEAFIAAKPTITGGGQFIGVSTPNFKNFFYMLVKDKI